MSIPRLNPYRSLITPPGAVARPARDRHSAREDAASLTERDRELIYQATGQRIDAAVPGQGWINSLAAAIAADRSAGRLAPGQEVTEVYLRDLARRYDENPTGRNPIAGYLDAALRHLDQHGPRTTGRLDVSA